MNFHLAVGSRNELLTLAQPRHLVRGIAREAHTLEP